jgi:hypothetical protein
VELHRVALRAGPGGLADGLLRAVALLPVSEDVLAAAETIRPISVATLDAIDLVTAVMLAEAGLVETVLTYGHRLADGAREHGLAVAAPAA